MLDLILMQQDFEHATIIVDATIVTVAIIIKLIIAKAKGFKLDVKALVKEVVE